MRLRVVILTMALGVVLAGNASAYDATGVIYDLSTLGKPSASKPDKGHEGIGVKDRHDRREWGHERGRGHGKDKDKKKDKDKDRDEGSDPGNERGNPSPTPEPGSMLLLGGALAAGIRRFRKR